MLRLFEVFIRHPRAVLLAAGIVLVLAGTRLPGFRLNSESEVLLQGDQRNYTSYKKVREVLQDVEVLVVSMECRDVFSNEGLDAVGRVSEAFLRLGGVIDVKSLTHSSKPVRRGLRFEMEALAPALPAAEEALAKLRGFALGHPLMKNVMVAEDGRHTLITVTLAPLTTEGQAGLRRSVDSVLKPFRAEGLRFDVLGMPLAEEEVRSSLARDLRWFVPAVTVLLTGILWLTFGSWRYVAIALVQQAAFVLALPAAASLSGYSVSIFSVILFPLLSGTQLTLLVHALASFQQQFRGLAGRGGSSLSAREVAAEATRGMLRDSFRSNGFAALTTAIGFASLIWSDVRPIREFGLLGVIGTVMLFGFIFGPGISLLQLAFGARGVVEKERLLEARRERERGLVAGRDEAWAVRLVEFVLKRRALVLAAGVAAAIGGCAGMRLIRTDVRVAEFLSPDSPTRQALEKLDRVYGGINVVQVELRAPAANGANDPAYLRWMEEVQRYAEAKPEVSGAYSYAQLLAMMNEIWQGGKPGSFRLPESPMLTGLFVAALKLHNFPFLTALADTNFQTGFVVVRSRDMESGQHLAMIEDIVRFAQSKAAAGMTVSAAKGLHSIAEADQRIIRGQIETAGSSIASVGVVLGILWRSASLALGALAANIAGVALLLGAAGFAGIPLNSITVMVAAICFGIAVDDTIHFVTHWQALRRSGLGAREALCEAMRAKGRAIVSTTVIFIAIFSVFYFSSFPPVVHFGALAAFGFAAALGGMLFLLPAILAGNKRE